MSEPNVRAIAHQVASELAELREDPEAWQAYLAEADDTSVPDGIELIRNKAPILRFWSCDYPEGCPGGREVVLRQVQPDKTKPSSHHLCYEVVEADNE